MYNLYISIYIYMHEKMVNKEILNLQKRRGVWKGLDGLKGMEKCNYNFKNKIMYTIFYLEKPKQSQKLVITYLF